MIIGISKGRGEGASKGKVLVLIGLSVQLVFFGLFVIVAAHWHRRVFAQTPGPHRSFRTWKRHMNVLYSASALITIRSIVKIIEFGQGTTGYLWVHEWPLYVSDTIPMFLVMVLLSWLHPVQIQVSAKIGSRDWICL